MSWSTRQVQFKSWDRMILPLPLGTIVMAFGKPTLVPGGLDTEAYERIRQNVEDEMIRISNQAEEAVKELLKHQRGYLLKRA